MAAWSAEFLQSIFDAAPEGIAICEARGAESPVVYANAAFERLTGYSAAELVGSDLRRLQGNDREQTGRTQLRIAIERGESTRALLRNYRKDGSLFWNEVLLEPVRDRDGNLTHFVGFHRDIGERDRAPETSRHLALPMSGLPRWMREDRLSGLMSRAYFEELLRHDWEVAGREGRALTLLMFDIDALSAYNDTFGRAAGDACIRRVAGVVAASFRRGADLVARWEGGTICALVRTTDVVATTVYAESVLQRVLEQHVHHPRSTRHKFVSVSAAIGSLNPERDRKPDMLIQAVSTALGRARAEPPGRVIVANDADYRSS